MQRPAAGKTSYAYRVPFINVTWSIFIPLFLGAFPTQKIDCSTIFCGQKISSRGVHESWFMRRMSFDALIVICCNQEIYRWKALAMGSNVCSLWLISVTLFHAGSMSKWPWFMRRTDVIRRSYCQCLGILQFLSFLSIQIDLQEEQSHS